LESNVCCLDTSTAPSLSNCVMMQISASSCDCVTNIKVAVQLTIHGDQILERRA
jgi:hypothetical protein